MNFDSGWAFPNQGLPDADDWKGSRTWPRRKATLFTGPGALTHKELLKVWKLAKAHSTFINPFPQTVKFRGVYKTGWIPALNSTPHVAATKYLSLKAELAAAQMSPAVLADMLGGMHDLVPVTGMAIANNFWIECRFGVPARADNPEEAKQAWLTLSSDNDQLWFRCVANDGFSHGASPHKTFAAERDYNEEALTRIITAARLPLRLVPAGKSFTVEHTAGGELTNMFEPDESGTSSFVCTVPGASPLDLANRLQQAFKALRPLSPPRYSCGLTAQNFRQSVDPCHAIYQYLQDQTWPVCSSEFSTVFQVNAPEGLESLRALLPSAGKKIRLELARFRPDAHAPRRAVTKLLVDTRQASYSLSLMLPPEQAAFQKVLQKDLGIVFADGKK